MSAAAVIEFRPLSIPRLIEQASVLYANGVVLSLREDGGVRGMTYSRVYERARRLANALTAIGVRTDDCVASVSRDDHRHVELFVAITSLGAALHPIDSRLEVPAIVRRVQSVGARYVFLDEAVASAQAVAGALREQIVGLVSISDGDPTAVPRGSSLDYERLLAEHQGSRMPVPMDSGTPAVVCVQGAGEDERSTRESHRTIVDGAFQVSAPDGEIGLSERDSVLLAAPLSLPKSWSLLCAAAASGARLVLAAPLCDPRQLCEFMRQEGTTVAVGTSQWWSGLLDYAQAQDGGFESIESLRRAVACGGMLHRAIGARVMRVFGAAAVTMWRTS